MSIPSSKVRIPFPSRRSELRKRLEDRLDQYASYKLTTVTAYNEFVPRIEEGKDADERDDRLRNRHNDPKHDPDQAQSVDEPAFRFLPDRRLSIIIASPRAQEQKREESPLRDCGYELSLFDFCRAVIWAI
jgi:hypothetical protein